MDDYLVVTAGTVYGFLVGGAICFLTDFLPGIRRRESSRTGVWAWMDATIDFVASWHKKLGLAGVAVQALIPSVVMTAAFIYVQKSEVGFLFGMQIIALSIFGTLVSMTDVKYHQILLPVNVVGAVTGVVLGVVRLDALPTVLGGLTNFLAMLLFYWLGKRISHFTQRAVDGAPMGFGDVLYSGALGFYLSFPLSYVGLMAGSLVGLLFVLMEIVRAALTKSDRRPIPYGPALTVGAIVVMVLMG